MRTGSWYQRAVAATVPCAAWRPKRHFSSSGVARQARHGGAYGAEGEEEGPTSRFPRRPESEADRLAKDIAALGNQRREARAKGKLHVPAQELPDMATAASGQSSPRASTASRVSSADRRRQEAAKVAFELSRVQFTPRHTTKSSSPPLAPAWEPPYPHRIPPRQPDGSVGGDIVGSVTEIAYTLDEMEQSLFTNKDAPPDTAVAGNAADDDAATVQVERNHREEPNLPSEVASRVAAADGTRLHGAVDSETTPPPVPAFPDREQQQQQQQQQRAKPARRAELTFTDQQQQVWPNDEPVSSSAPQPPEDPVGFSAAAKEERTEKRGPQPRWVHDNIPCCLTFPETELTAEAQRNQPPAAEVGAAPLLSIRFEPSSASYVVAPKSPVATTQELVSSLNEALTWLEGRYGEAEVARRAGRGAAAAGTAPRVTSVMLHFSTATLAGWTDRSARGERPPVVLQPTESELSLSALERLRLTSVKERLLHRLSTAVEHGLRVTAVVGERSLVADFAAELLLCCHDCYMVGSLEDMVVGFPSLQYGVLPSPTALTVLRRRVEHVMSNDSAKKKRLLAQLDTVGATDGLGGTAAAAPEEVVAALVPRLHTVAFAVWAELGLWEPVPARTPLRTAWWQLSFDRVVGHLLRRRRAQAREEEHLSSGTSPSADAPAFSPTLATPPAKALWIQYCKVATHAGEASSALPWREDMMSLLDSAECHNATALYGYARRSLRAATPGAPSKVVYINDRNTPEKLSAPELRQALVKDSPEGERITVVLDAKVPLKKMEQLLATLRASAGEAPENTAEDCFDVVLVGDSSTLTTCASVVPTVAVVAPVGRAVAEGLPLLTSGLPRAMEPTRLLTSLVEVALLPVPSKVGRDGSASEPPGAALVHAQCAAVQFLVTLGLPFVLSSSGEEGIRLVAGLALDLCRVMSEEPTVPVGAVLAALERRVRFAEPVSATVSLYGVDRIYHHVASLVKEAGRGAEISYDDVTRLFHKLAVARESAPICGAAEPSSPFSPAAALGTVGNDRRLVEGISQRLFLSLVDRSATALLQGTLCCAADANLLSVAALSLAPESGGVLAIVDQHINRGDWAPLCMEMELCMAQTNRRFLSLPLLRWMSTHALRFSELSEGTLARARAELLLASP